MYVVTEIRLYELLNYNRSFIEKNIFKTFININLNVFIFIERVCNTYCYVFIFICILIKAKFVSIFNYKINDKETKIILKNFNKL